MPIEITRRDAGLLLTWDQVGAAWYPSRTLRLACPCAQCVEEMTSKPLLDAAAVPLDIRPVHVALVGTYGLKVHWSDGHATGIYTFEWLSRHGAAPVPS